MPVTRHIKVQAGDAVVMVGTMKGACWCFRGRSRRMPGVNSALDTAFERHPQLRRRIFTEQGQLRPNVNVFIDGRNIRFEDGLATAVPEAAEVFVLPAISGG